MFLPLFVFGVPLLIMFLVISGLLFIAFLSIRGTVRSVRRLANRPQPTQRLRQKLDDIPVPFPTEDEFARSQAEQLLAAWDDKLPLKPLFDRMVRIAGALYDAQGFDPLAPPPPPSPNRSALVVTATKSFRGCAPRRTRRKFCRRSIQRSALPSASSSANFPLARSRRAMGFKRPSSLNRSSKSRSSTWCETQSKPSPI